MKIRGYSERGMINSLFYEIQTRNTPEVLIQDILSRTQDINITTEKSIVLDIKTVELLIEQSFSDFGDADALLLIETQGGKKISIFIEAKVKAQSTWLIKNQFDKFLKGISPTSKLSSSNLFTQLYHKAQMVDNLKKHGLSSLKTGVAFPSCSSKQIRKIGNNPVVLKAVNMLSSYLNETYYIMLIPDTLNASNFFNPSTPKGFHSSIPAISTALTGWSHSNIYYLLWKDVYDFCVNNTLNNTLANFEFNKGQIY